MGAHGHLPPLRKTQTMTAVIKLGNKPKTFKPFPVKFTMPDGEEGAINTTFKYRTRKEYGAFLNDLYHSADTEKPPEGEKIDFEALFAKGGEKTVKKLIDAIDSWEFGYDLTVETLLQLQDEIPASIAAFGDAYRGACLDGRLGN